MDEPPVSAAPAASRIADDPVSVADYVADMAGELAALARANGLATLAYILDMARLEARSNAVARRGRTTVAEPAVKQRV